MPALPDAQGDRGQGEGRGPRGAGEARCSCVSTRAPSRSRARRRPLRRPCASDGSRAPRPAPAARAGVAGSACASTRRASKEPEVSVNLPLGLAELVFKSLPDDARKDLKLKGYDADNFWDRLKKLGPTEILSIDGKDGERVQIWLE